MFTVEGLGSSVPGQKMSYRYVTYTWSEDVLYVTLSILVLTNYPSSVNVELADIKTYDREYSIIGRRLLATQIISGIFKTPPDAGVCHQA